MSPLTQKAFGPTIPDDGQWKDALWDKFCRRAPRYQPEDRRQMEEEDFSLRPAGRAEGSEVDSAVDWGHPYQLP